MAKYENLVPSVAIHVSPCPEQAVIAALKHVVRDFCKETKGWVIDAPSIQTNAAELNYLLDLPEHTTVVHVWGIEGRNNKYSESDQYYFSFPNQISFKKAPDVTAINPVVSLMPSVDSEEYPDYLAEYFDAALVAGTVAYLQMQPFRAWSQPNAAGIHQQQYLEGIGKAKLMRDNGLNISKVKRRVRPQYI